MAYNYSKGEQIVKQKLKIILTNGQIRKKIIWMYINKKKEPVLGFGYIKFVNRLSQDFHFTFHKDGNQSYRFYGERKLYVKAHPPWDGHGIRHLQSFNILPDVQEESLWVNYLPEKRDVILEINNTEYVQENCRIFGDVYLLEQNRKDLIKNIHSEKTDSSLIYTFDQFDPWIVVCISKKKLTQ